MITLTKSYRSYYLTLPNIVIMCCISFLDSVVSMKPDTDECADASVDFFGTIATILVLALSMIIMGLVKYGN